MSSSLTFCTSFVVFLVLLLCCPGSSLPCDQTLYPTNDLPSAINGVLANTSITVICLQTGSYGGCLGPLTVSNRTLIIQAVNGGHDVMITCPSLLPAHSELAVDSGASLTLKDLVIRWDGTEALASPLIVASGLSTLNFINVMVIDILSSVFLANDSSVLVVGSQFGGCGVLDPPPSLVDESLGGCGTVVGPLSRLDAVNSSFERGISASSGGALLAVDAEVFISNCSFEANTATEKGGALYLLGGSAFVEGSTFSDGMSSLALGTAVAADQVNNLSLINIDVISLQSYVDAFVSLGLSAGGDVVVQGMLCSGVPVTARGALLASYCLYIDGSPLAAVKLTGMFVLDRVASLLKGLDETETGLSQISLVGAHVTKSVTFEGSVSPLILLSTFAGSLIVNDSVFLDIHTQFVTSVFQLEDGLTLDMTSTSVINVATEEALISAYGANLVDCYILDTDSDVAFKQADNVDAFSNFSFSSTHFENLRGSKMIKPGMHPFHTHFHDCFFTGNISQISLFNSFPTEGQYSFTLCTFWDVILWTGDNRRRGSPPLDGLVYISTDGMGQRLQFVGNQAIGVSAPCILVLSSGIVTGNTFMNNFGSSVCVRPAEGSDVVISNCTFSDNQGVSNSPASGGALVIQQSSAVSITDCNFEANTALTGTLSMVEVGSETSSWVFVSSCIFDGNQGIQGGVLHNFDSVMVNDSLFKQNSAEEGAVLSWDDDNNAKALVEFSDCLFVGNSVSGKGGISSVTAGRSVVMTSCSFSNNTADGVGALFVVSDVTTFLNLTRAFVFGNEAVRGVLFVLSGSEIVVSDSEFRANRDGTIFAVDAESIVVSDTLIWKNVGSAITSLFTRTILTFVMIRENDVGALSAVDLISSASVAFSNVFIGSNTGVGLSCTGSQLDLGSASDAVVCGHNRGNVACQACSSFSRDQTLVDSLCALTTPESCLEVCDSSTLSGYCVNQTFFAGPYDGCFDCGGQCFLSNPCPPDALCQDTVNLIGICECPVGFIFNNSLCVDVNECSSSPCPPNGECENIDGSYTCTCASGYDGPLCSDIDECSNGTQPCEASSEECDNLDGSFTCKCRFAFYGSPSSTGCHECPPFSSTSEEAAVTTISDCTCLDGYYRLNPTNFSQPCALCPPGYFEESATLCSPCRPDTYSAVASQAECSDCPAYSSTSGLHASTSLDACLCDTGYIPVPHVEGGCQSSSFADCGCFRNCSQGWFVNEQGDCEICPPDTYSSQALYACTECPLGASTEGRNGCTRVDDCVCPPFFVLHTDINQGMQCVLQCPPGTFTSGETCFPCPSGTFSSNYSTTVCTPCPPNTNTEGDEGGKSSSDACHCVDGFEKQPLGLGGSLVCALTCQPGEARVALDYCETCPVGFFSDTTNALSCTPCMAGSSTVEEGATNVENCTCLEWYEEVVDPASNRRSCVKTCPPGYFLPDEQSPCLLCDPNTFSTVFNARNCTPCPFNTHTDEEYSITIISPTLTLTPTTISSGGSWTNSGPASADVRRDNGNEEDEGSRNGGPPNTLSPTTKTISRPAVLPFSPPSLTSRSRSTTTTTISSSKPYPLLNDSSVCVCNEGFTLPLGAAVGTACTLVCDAGSFLPTLDTNACWDCPVDTYAAAPNTTGACTPCPEFSDTRGSTRCWTATQCACSRGYFREFTGEAGGGEGGGGGSGGGGGGGDDEQGSNQPFLCRVCPNGATCAGGDEPPVPKDGFTMVDGNRIVACTPSEACVAGGSCGQGYTGSLCSECAEHFFRLEGRCTPCSRSRGGGVLLILALLAVLVAVAARISVSNLSDQVGNWLAATTIAVNSLQVLSLFGRVNLNWSSGVATVFSVLSVANFNIELVAPECAVSTTNPFVLRWILMLFMPAFVLLAFLVVFGLFFLVHKYELRSWLTAAIVDSSVKHLRNTVQRSVYQVLVLIYLPMSTTVFSFFACGRNGLDELVITSSPDMHCYTPHYNGLIVVAILGVLAYPLGIPALYAGLLRWKRHTLGEAKFFLRYSFLVGRYRVELFYFELAVMLRKVGIVVCTTFISTNSSVQAWGAVIVITGALVVHVFALPYHTNIYNYMETVCLFCSLFILTFSIMLEDLPPTSVGKNVVVVSFIVVLLITATVGVFHDLRVRSQLRAQAKSGDDGGEGNESQAVVIEMSSLHRGSEGESWSGAASGRDGDGVQTDSSVPEDLQTVGTGRVTTVTARQEWRGTAPPTDLQSHSGVSVWTGDGGGGTGASDRGGGSGGSRFGSRKDANATASMAPSDLLSLGRVSAVSDGVSGGSGSSRSGLKATPLPVSSDAQSMTQLSVVSNDSGGGLQQGGLRP